MRKFTKIFRILMASPRSVNFTNLRRDIAAGRLAPVYLLHGEEGYFIDELTKDFEKLVPETERDFNLYTLYAPQVKMDLVAATCRRVPMMAARQVVILKEAQAISGRDLNLLAPYAEQPNPSTVLVISSRGEKAKGTALLNAVKKSGIVFESKKPNDQSVDILIRGIIKDNGLNIEEKGLAMLRDHVGNDVARIYNEINKLVLILGKGSTITPQSIERNVGVSKDYNNFELVDAIATRNLRKTMVIINHFKLDPKRNPTVLTIAAIFNYFSNLMISHFTPDKSPKSQMEALGFKWESQLKNINAGVRNYNARKTIEIITHIREFDARSKGIGSRMNEYDLLQELIFKIFAATGNLGI